MTQKNRMIQMSWDSVIVGGKYVSTHYDVRLPLPYPFYISEGGEVADQEFWKGFPRFLVGFQATTDHRIDLTVREWFKGDPDGCVGMVPVFRDVLGGVYTDRRPVIEVIPGTGAHRRGGEPA